MVSEIAMSICIFITATETLAKMYELIRAKMCLSQTGKVERELPWHVFADLKQ